MMLNLPEEIKKHFKGIEVDVAIVLGSGLGGFEDLLKNKTEYPYKNIPSYPKSSVKGHKGSLFIGDISGKKVAVFSGRSHLYEGIDPKDAVINVLLSHYLKAKQMIITNAAGGINFGDGAIVQITDHLNLTGKNPLIGKNNGELGERFPDMSNIYKYTDLIKDEFNIEQGVYAGVLGPNYETPAEVRMLGKMGADMVGMSTVLEAIVANYLKMEVIGFSLITNFAAGASGKKETLTHEEVTEVGKRKTEEFKAMIKRLLTYL